MFLPIGDTPNPPRFIPWVTWGLIAINVAIYFFISFPLSAEPIDPNDPALNSYLELISRHLPPGVGLTEVVASLSAYDLYVFEHGYQPGAPSLSDLGYAMFLHGGFMHLAGNMLFLWIYGDNCEHRIGRLLYLGLYLAGGVAATLTFSAFAHRSMTPLVGASGAISAVLGLYFLMFPRNHIKVFVLLFPILFRVILIPARWVLAFFVIVDNLFPFLMTSSGGGGVAYGAHLGGFFAGLGAGWIGERLVWSSSRKEQYHSAKRSANRGAVKAGGGSDLERAIASGDRTETLRLFSSTGADAVDALGPEATAQLAEWLIDAGAPHAANDMLRRSIARHRGARGPAIARMYLQMGLLRLTMGQPTAAYQFLLAVFDHQPDGETDARARRALSTIDVYRKR